MKEYEKLAEDWYNNNAAFDGLKEAYIAGFLKAREIAFELLEEDPRSFKFDVEMINLGEKEV